MAASSSTPRSRPIAPGDSIWLSMDRPNNLMVIVSVMFLGEVPDWSDVTHLLQERILDTYPVFRQRPQPSRLPGFPARWVDDPDFDLDRHLLRATLPEPGDDAALQRYMEQHVSRPLDPDHPLWEAHFVEGYRSGAAIVLRTHHAMADGLALGQVLISLTDDQASGPSDSPAEAPRRKDPSRDPFALGLDLARDVLGRTLRLWTPKGMLEAAQLALRTTQVAGVLLLAHNPETPLAGTPAPSKRIAWSGPIPLAGTKQAGRDAGATVNDVLLTAMAAALRVYQQGREREPVDLITMVPVSLRPLDDPLPRELGNDFTLVYFRYPSSTHGTLARLAETTRRMDWIKESPEIVLTSTLMNVIGRVGRGVDRVVIDFFADKAIGVTTNVIGPRRRRWLAGVPVDGVLGWVPGSSQHTIGVCIFSYAETVRVGLITDAVIVPDPERLVAAFEAELDRLVDLSGPVTSSP